MTNPYKVFHSSWDSLRSQIHILLARPEESQNVGSVARAVANMGIQSPLRLFAPKTILDERAKALAKHAWHRLESALFFETFEAAIAFPADRRVLRIAATARVGSAHRPHPLAVQEAIPMAVQKLKEQEIDDILIVFGPESDGLSNDEVAPCDWIVTIPSSQEYRSLNLAQSVLVFSYEVQRALLEKVERAPKGLHPTQKERLVQHLIQLAEEVGFILPNDPHKMRPRLEKLFSGIPNYIEDAKTLHGLLDQIRRSVKRGFPDIKGRYRHFFKAPPQELEQEKEKQI